MSTPSRDRFIEVGERFASNNVLSQHEYLRELVKRDAVDLAKHGFPVAWGTAMNAKAAELAALQSSRNVGRGGKQAKRAKERTDVGLGKDWILQATTILKNAAESPIDPKPELGAAIKPFLSPVGRDAQDVGSRVSGILLLFKGKEWSPVLAPMIPPGSDLLPVGESIAAALPTAKGVKVTAQAQSVVDTADLDELDGRLWYFFKAANRAGRSHWRAKKDRARANEYSLDLLHEVVGAPRRAPSVDVPVEGKPKT